MTIIIEIVTWNHIFVWIFSIREEHLKPYNLHTLFVFDTTGYGFFV